MKNQFIYLDRKDIKLRNLNKRAIEGRSRHEAIQGKRLVWISNKIEFSKNAKTTMWCFKASIFCNFLR